MRINNNNTMYELILNRNKLKNGIDLEQKPKSNLMQGRFSADVVDFSKSVIKEDKRIKNPDGSDYISMTGGNSHLLDKEDFRTGYDWIDSFTFRRDSDGPYTKEELYHLNRIKLSLALEQKKYDHDYEKGWSEKRKVDPNKYLDDEGYFKNAFATSSMPKMKRREELNSRINDLFKTNGIEISEKDELKFTMDPYNRVTVSGDVDDAKKKAIEKVLNENNMGKQLVATRSGIAYKTRNYTKIEYDKYQINSNLKRYANMDLRDFEYDGKSLVSKYDGRNILDVYYEAIDNAESVPDVSKAYVKAEFSDTLKRVLNYGYESVGDINFEIGFVGNKLYDIDAVYGYGFGQTGWYDDLYNSRGDFNEFCKYAEQQFQVLTPYDKYNQFYE